VKLSTYTAVALAVAIECFCHAAFSVDMSLVPRIPAPEKQHLCTSADLVHHTWKAVDVMEIPPLKQRVLFEGLPHHYLYFFDTQRYSFIYSGVEYKTPADARQVMKEWPEIGHHLLVYSVDDKGELRLYADNKLKFRYRCVIVDKTTKGVYLKGDMLVTGFTWHANSYLFKHYKLLE
jgi:hypothetical protein